MKKASKSARFGGCLFAQNPLYDTLRLQVERVGQTFQFGVVLLDVIQLGDLGRGATEKIGYLFHGQAFDRSVRLLDSVDQGRGEGVSECRALHFRHTYTTNLLANGARPKDVQELLGHSDVSTTMNIYAHATRESKKSSVKLLDTMTG